MFDCVVISYLSIMEVSHFFDNGFVADNISITSTVVSDEDDIAILKENQAYSKQYKDLMRDEGNQLDALHQYKRGWMQTFNLIIASVALGVLIYRQK
jgi:hypothetical protein